MNTNKHIKISIFKIETYKTLISTTLNCNIQNKKYDNNMN